MVYSLVGIIAIGVHLIVNLDVILNIRGKKRFSGELFYLLFLFSVIAYHITDGLWGFLYDAKLSTAVFADTTVYFVAMAASILFWTVFVYRYLGEKGKINKSIVYVGFAIFSVQIIIIIINFFAPILFSVTPDCVNSAEPARYVMLGIQILAFLLVSIYAFVETAKKSDSAKRRYAIVGLFGIFMIIFISLQVAFPLLPMYSIGFLAGVCALHTFVVEDEKANQKQELEEAKHEVEIDSLTGVYSKHAYVDIEATIDVLIANKTMSDFAIVIFDLNDLKKVNDNLGHEAGDNYIINATRLIADIFVDVPIYRIGGDEFVIILENANFDNRWQLLHVFEHQIDANARNDEQLVISSGMSSYDNVLDNTIRQVFVRADQEMYNRKHYLKSITNLEE